MIKVYLSDIIITQEFKKSVPKKRKLQKCQKYWENHRQQDRYIVINDKNELIDGYIQYLVLQQNSIDSAECIRSNEKNECWNRKPMITYKDEPTIYILGQHLGQHKENNKIYYWRIPRSWTYFVEKVDNLSGNASVPMSSKVTFGFVIFNAITYSSFTSVAIISFAFSTSKSIPSTSG